LKASNSQTILDSEGYKGKVSCSNGIASVRKNSQDPKRFVKKQTPSGKFVFSLTSPNGQVIGTSQTYASESGRNNGIKSVANTAPGASVDDQA